ncbi:MAG: hypothetical protein IJ264_03730, partial [Clostridia bacterium]|nr:hypothetical protein [Clostridia bacterium]
MKKNKILISAIIGIVVVMAGIVTAMFATGRFDALKENFGDETTAAPIEQTTPTVAPVSGRPKSAQPASIVASFYSEYSENSAAELAAFGNYGFNTVIFNLTAENASSVSTLLDAAKANSLYFGIYADIAEKYDFVTAFVEKFNVDFVILGGYDETLSTYTEKITPVSQAIKAIDPAVTVGIEPVFCSKVSDTTTNAVASGIADFVFLSHERGKDSAFNTAQNIWNEEACNLWLCHDMSGISSYSTEDASAMIDMISKSVDMSLCKAIVFTPFSEISKASGTSAEIVLTYIQKRETYLLDKEFSISNHKGKSITVEQSKITFRGTSSPAYDLLCNGQKLDVAKTGDFSVDCELSPGKNTIKFEHKGKTHVYTVTYKVKLLKSVSPSDDLSVPGGMIIEFSAVALKKANVSLSFNGKTYKMTQIETEADSDDTSPDSESEFATFVATVTAPDSMSYVRKLGQYKVTAKYSGLTETLTGANISVAAKEVVTAPPTTANPATTQTATTDKPTEAPDSPVTDTDQTKATEAIPSETTASTESITSQTNNAETSNASTTEKPSSSERLQKYYYTENYGLGNALICEIIDDYVEVYPGNTTSTYSVPDCSPLIKSTVDYVKTQATFDGDPYYILESGIKVPKFREERLASGSEGTITHVSIKDGYRMPKNSIKVV